MENWEKALKKFLQRYENEDYYEGAIACGSYVSGNNNEFSDIDVHIVLKRGNEWRERGNLEIDGFLIEYFANPVNKYESYMEDEKIDFSDIDEVDILFLCLILGLLNSIKLFVHLKKLFLGKGDIHHSYHAGKSEYGKARKHLHKSAA